MLESKVFTQENAREVVDWVRSKGTVRKWEQGPTLPPYYLKTGHHDPYPSKPEGNYYDEQIYTYNGVTDDTFIIWTAINDGTVRFGDRVIHLWGKRFWINRRRWAQKR